MKIFLRSRVRILWSQMPQEQILKNYSFASILCNFCMLLLGCLTSACENLKFNLPKAPPKQKRKLVFLSLLQEVYSTLAALSTLFDARFVELLNVCLDFWWMAASDVAHFRWIVFLHQEFSAAGGKACREAADFWRLVGEIGKWQTAQHCGRCLRYQETRIWWLNRKFDGRRFRNKSFFRKGRWNWFISIWKIFKIENVYLTA